VTNHLRLLELDEPTRLLVREGALTMGHAKALLSITNLLRRSAMAMQAVKRGWSVRELEQRAKDEAQATTRSDDDSPAKSVNRAVANAMDLARRLSEHLGTKVHVQPGRTKGSGRLIIDFYSLDQFEGLLHRLQYKGD
jgi:ParB family chromosome partitioning protein